MEALILTVSFIILCIAFATLIYRAVRFSLGYFFGEYLTIKYKDKDGITYSKRLRVKTQEDIDNLIDILSSPELNAQYDHG